MARAHRHYLPGQIWHLTHRCHERQFLPQFIRDRQSWIGWLFEARKRLGPRARGRDVIPAETGCQLREDEATYEHNFEGEKDRLSLENTRFWQLSSYPKAT
jgi:hypothetical protein